MSAARPFTEASASVWWVHHAGFNTSTTGGIGWIVDLNYAGDVHGIYRDGVSSDGRLNNFGHKYDHASIPSGTLHHSVWIRKGTSYQYYLDGVRVVNVSTSAFAGSSSIQLAINGMQYRNPSFVVKDIAVFNKALTAGDVTLLFSTGVRQY